VVVGFAHATIQDAFTSAQQLVESFRLNVIGSVSWVGAASPRHQVRETLAFGSAIVGLLLMYGVLMIAIVLPSTTSVLSLNPRNIRFDELTAGIQRAFDLLRSAF
jgi:hypothetical protein